jgi:hypothetical protein
MTNSQSWVRNPWVRNFERHNQYFVYSIQHIENLESIQEHGILSRYIIQNHDFPSVDISYPRAQLNRRENAMNNSDGTLNGEVWFRNITSRGYDLHEFVPLHLVKFAPMWFSPHIQSNISDHCILEISIRKVCKESEVIFATDGNLVNRETKFITNPDDIRNIDWEQIKSTDPIRSRPGWKRIRAAELLIYPNVPRNAIHDICKFPR